METLKYRKRSKWREMETQFFLTYLFVGFVPLGIFVVWLSRVVGLNSGPVKEQPNEWIWMVGLFVGLILEVFLAALLMGVSVTQNLRRYYNKQTGQNLSFKEVSGVTYSSNPQLFLTLMEPVPEGERGDSQYDEGS